VARKNAANVLGYLHDREMMNSVYLPKWLPVRLPSENVTAYAFIADRRHQQYTGRLDDQDAVKFILQGRGKRGHCLNYLQNTLHHLDELGIADAPLHRLVKLAEKASA
jgi:cation transport protein ChaC